MLEQSAWWIQYLHFLTLIDVSRILPSSQLLYLLKIVLHKYLMIWKEDDFMSESSLYSTKKPWKTYQTRKMYRNTYNGGSSIILIRKSPWPYTRCFENKIKQLHPNTMSGFKVQEYFQNWVHLYKGVKISSCLTFMYNC